MSNLATTEYRIYGNEETIINLWKALKDLGKNNIYLSNLAKHYDIDYEKAGINVRGKIYYASLENELTEKEEKILNIETETSWTDCTELLQEINKKLGNKLSISYKVIEPGCEVYKIHDEADFFPEKIYVTASGEIFEKYEAEGAYKTITDAIDIWCKAMKIERNNRSDEEMEELIEYYEYENEDTYFNINEFEFE